MSASSTEPVPPDVAEPPSGGEHRPVDLQAPSGRTRPIRTARASRSGVPATRFAPSSLAARTRASRFSDTNTPRRRRARKMASASPWSAGAQRAPRQAEPQELRLQEVHGMLQHHRGAEERRLEHAGRGGMRSGPAWSSSASCHLREDLVQSVGAGRPEMSSSGASPASSSSCLSWSRSGRWRRSTIGSRRMRPRRKVRVARAYRRPGGRIAAAAGRPGRPRGPSRAARRGRSASPPA
jgi:hypothetical protein